MISFNPFWKTIENKHISQYDLINYYNINTYTLNSIRHNKSITLNTLNDLCSKLDCNVEDIIEFIPDVK
jgi:DNA-binding Xre family transcriptional regulator